jgi:hypothetical protein
MRNINDEKAAALTVLARKIRSLGLGILEYPRNLLSRAAVAQGGVECFYW